MHIGTKFFFVVSCIGLLLFPSISQAATIFVSPAAVTKNVTETFSVDVFVSSPDQPTNALSGTISFPKELLQVQSVSQAGSVISFWVQAPIFSNSEGTIQFEGIAFNPGFTGKNGKLFTITFQGTAAGLAAVSFASASALANDGSGTQILSGTQGGSFRVNSPVVTDAAVPAPAVVSSESPTPPPTPVQNNSGVLPVITSPTHPDSAKWYNQNDVTFQWNLPAGVTAVRVLFDELPETTPTVVYTPPVKEKTITDVEDGVWYMHVQFQQAGTWGRVAHFPVQIDTIPPEAFTITFPHDKDRTDPRPIALFNTPDLLSGISHYEIRIGNGDFYTVQVREVESNPYALPVQPAGTGTLMVKAVDQAGNVATSTQNFEVASLPSPRVTNYLDTIEKNDILLVQGETLPMMKLMVSLMDSQGKVQTIQERSSLIGNFRVIWPKRLDVGVYHLSVVAIDDRGGQSEPSEAITITVKPPTFLLFGSRAISFVSFITACILLLVGFVCFILKAWRTVVMFRRGSQKEMGRTEVAVTESFASLHKKIMESIALLEQADEKRRLTKEERNILYALKKEIDDVEQSTKKSLRRVGGLIDKADE